MQRLPRLLGSIYLAGSPIYSIIDSRVGVSATDAHSFLLLLEIGDEGSVSRRHGDVHCFCRRGRTCSRWVRTWARGAMSGYLQGRWASRHMGQLLGLSPSETLESLLLCLSGLRLFSLRSS